MCGIVGVFAFKEDNVTKKQFNREAMLYLFTELLQITQSRGKDATGASALFNDGNFLIQKGGVPADDFISNVGKDKSNYSTFLDSCRKYKEQLKLLVGHCRKSSVGTNYNNNNNHPIKAGKIVGVHNGTLTNHEKIFTKLGCKRDGTVDTEAIMRLLDFYTVNGTTPFTIDMLTEVARRLDGAFSTITYNIDNPFQVALMKRQRPMEIALVKPLGLMIVASEIPFIDHVLFEFNKFVSLYKGGYPVLKKADVEKAIFPMDNVGIVDLTMSILPDTKVEDLLDKFDTFKTPKLWQTTYVTYGTGANSNFNRKGNFPDKGGKKNDTVVENVNRTTNLLSTIQQEKDYAGVHGVAPIVDKKRDFFKGKVFNKELGRYVDATKADSLIDVAAVILANNSTTVEFVIDNAVDSGVDTDLVKEVIDLQTETLIKPVSIHTVEAKVEKVEAKEVVMIEEQVSTDVLRAAQLAALGSPRFSTEDEISTFLQATSVSSLKVLPIHALANRVGASIYEKAFLEGAAFCQNVQKSRQAEKVIRITKGIIKLFGKVLGRACPQKETYVDAMALAAVELRLSELTKDNMTEVFSKGDLIDNPGLIELVKLVDKRKYGKENNIDTIA